MSIETSSAYIDLLKKTLIDYSKIDSHEYHPLKFLSPSWKISLLAFFDKILRLRNFSICKLKFVSKENRINGYDWPVNADTMIGLNRLNNIEFCINRIIENKIPGDFIETGVWRGGATILMKALLKEKGIQDKIVWLADSFEGLPKPNSIKYPADKDNKLHALNLLKVSLEDVKNNFNKYGLLDDNVKFLKGWFKDTLPAAPIKDISLLRLDGDMYESTILALKYLYPKLSAGGFIIVDDYNAFSFCKKAVDDYRNENKIFEEIIKIDKEAIYWKKAISE